MNTPMMRRSCRLRESRNEAWLTTGAAAAALLALPPAGDELRPEPEGSGCSEGRRRAAACSASPAVRFRSSSAAAAAATDMMKSL